MADKALDIEDLPGVGPSTADKLREAGYLSVESIATASPAELSEITEISESTAKKIIKAARESADIGGFKTGKDIFEQRKDIRKLSFRFRSSTRSSVAAWKPKRSPRCTVSLVPVKARSSTRWQSTSSCPKSRAALMAV